MPTVLAEELSAHQKHVALLLAERGRLLTENAELRARALSSRGQPSVTPDKMLVGKEIHVTHEGGLVHAVPKEDGADNDGEKAAKWSANAGSLWPRPRVLRDGDANDLNYELERDMTWSELFFDLIFVVAIARLGEQLKDESATDIDFFGYVIYFFCYWGVWYQAAVYGNQYGTNDLPNMLFFSVVMGCVCFMTIHIKGGEGGPRVQGFAASAAAANVFVFLQNFRVWIFIDSVRSRGSARLAMFRSSTHCLFYSLAAASSGSSPLIAWRMFQCCFFFDVVCLRILILCRGARSLFGFIIGGQMLPFHLEHINERVGLLIIIFLGDNVANVTSSFARTYVFFFTVLAGFVVVVCLKTLFFDADAEDIDNHAMRRSVVCTLIWWNCAATLCLGISLFGNGMSLVCAHVAGQNKGPAVDRQFIMCYGLALTLLSMTALALSHKRDWHDPKKLETVPKIAKLRHIFVVQQATHLGASAGICALPWLGVGDPLLMGILAAGGMVLVALNLADEVVELAAARDAQRVQAGLQRLTSPP